MKIELYNKIKFFLGKIPMNTYIKLVRKKTILPFYHSVTNDPKPHIKQLNYYRTKNEFKNDLTFFLKHYKSVPVSDIKKINYPSFHLSFDDGLSEVYEQVIPLLIKNKVDATFFINTDFIENKNMFYRHKISLITDFLKKSDDDLNKVASFLSCENNAVITKINNITDDKKLEQIAKLLKIDFKQYLIDFKPYLTKKQLSEMIKLGFTVANHSKSHLNFKNIPLNKQKKQVREVNNYLQKELNIKNLYFSFPFGDENIKNDFFNFIYTDENIIYSFGISGLKNDQHKNHLHRIPMEYQEISAEQIIKYEYFYFILKSVLNKNTVKRKSVIF